jgi:hypothetical protein
MYKLAEHRKKCLPHCHWDPVRGRGELLKSLKGVQLKDEFIWNNVGAYRR